MRQPLFHLLGGEQASAAATVFALVAIAQTISHTGALVQVALLIPLTQALGANGAAVALCVSVVLVNAAAAGIGLAKLASAERAQSAVVLSEAETARSCAVASAERHDLTK